MKKKWLLLGILLSCTACQPNCCKIEPCLSYTPQARQIQCLPSPFEKLTREEIRHEWGKELYVALVFANEMDLYRAITCLKRALIFLPPSKRERKLQIQYNIVQCYYLGQKYGDVLEAFNESDLCATGPDFPAYRELMIMLYDSYKQTEQEEKASSLLKLIEENDPDTAKNLLISTAFSEGDLGYLKELSSEHPQAPLIDAFVDGYCNESKSVQKARNLNAILPGAGYYYVGQTKAALTSFLINSLFIGTAYYFFKNNNIPAGLITTSLETGWYIGGINGAGLAAKEYNERLYEVNGKQVMIHSHLFPIFMFQKSF
jgi:hypothetical protein